MNNPITQAIEAPKLADEVVRYCPECGTIGPLPDVRQACCPDSFGMSVRRWQAEKMERKLEGLRTAIARLRAVEAGELPPPLFLLHTGEVDGSCEQDDWETEADSGKRVDDYCQANPGKTVFLYPEDQVRTAIASAVGKAGGQVPPELDVRRILLDVVPGDGDGVEVYATCVADVEARLGKMGEELEDWQLGIRRYAAAPEAPAQADPWPSSEQASLARADANLLGRGFTVDGVRVAPERVVVVKPDAPAQAFPASLIGHEGGHYEAPVQAWAGDPSTQDYSSTVDTHCPKCKRTDGNFCDWCPTVQAAPSAGEVERVLAYLDDLKDDAAVHIWPDDLEKCQTSECVVEVYSVRMGSPDGKTVPLFSRDQVAEAVRAALSHKEQR